MKKILIQSLMYLFPIILGNMVSNNLSAVVKQKQVVTRINKNVEFVGFVMFMGWMGLDIDLNNEMKNVKGKQVRAADWYAYGYSVYKQYKVYCQSNTLHKLVEIGNTLDYSPVVELMLLVDDFPNATITKQTPIQKLLPFSVNNNPEEARRNAAEFISLLNIFYKEVDFDAYFQNSEKYYQIALGQVKESEWETGFIESMEKFYREKHKSYTFIPSLLIPSGMGFGFRKGSGRQMELFNISGPFNIQAFNEENSDMGFGDKQSILEMSIHEFGHSFVNPVLNDIPDSILAKSAPLFESIRNEMTRQGYHNWKSCLVEHFVRAGEIIVAESMGFSENARLLKDWYINNKKYVYLEFILTELKKYEMHEYKTYTQTVEAVIVKLQNMVKQN